jgi:CubicO group peptidase (beta-lactamase class C family)
MPLTNAIQTILANSEIAACDLSTGHHHTTHLAVHWRRHDPQSPGQLQPTANGRYLIASLTKPIVSLLAVLQAAQGRFWLNEHLRSFRPDFRRGPLRTITLRHLLTHSSGLPDMLPENEQLRTAHASVAQFAAATAQQDPAFPPGTATSYCSMGFALLQSVVELTAEQPLPQLLQQQLLTPLGMQNSWLGLPTDRASALLQDSLPCELPPGQSPHTDWHWNSLYWRTLGAPWGGMTSSASDLGKLLGCLASAGQLPGGQQLLPPRAVAASLANQTSQMAGLPVVDRDYRPWGLGWRLNWPDHNGCFSDFLPATAAGHWGATGTLMWLDPNSGRWCVILTNQPFERSQRAIQQLSNLIAAHENPR